MGLMERRGTWRVRNGCKLKKFGDLSTNNGPSIQPKNEWIIMHFMLIIEFIYASAKLLIRERERERQIQSKCDVTNNYIFHSFNIQSCILIVFISMYIYNNELVVHYITFEWQKWDLQISN